MTSSPLTTHHSRLFLIGPRGSGKTTVARLLAEQLGWDWVDADAVLEAREERTIREVFAEEGEAGFREKEAGLLSELCQRERCVVATGGGAVLRSDNRERMSRAGQCVWLTADAQTLWQRMQGDPATAKQRPALGIGGLAEVEEVVRVREPLYGACANLIVDTARHSPQEVAGAILTWLGSS